MQQKKPIILVDGSSYLYRAFHALPALMNSKGFPTGAIYGMTNMLRKLMTDFKPEYMAVIFDTKGKTFRDDLYQAYKATRKEMPDDLGLQIPRIYEIIQAMGLPLVMMEGIEADDIIGTFAAHIKGQKVELLVSTGDKDLAQLVNPQVKLINTMTNVILDEQGVESKFGIPPERIIDYLTLVGDTTDNIPGVPLVGPKTAVKWLKQYGSLDNIIKNAHAIPGKVGENLRASLAHLPLTKVLVTIKPDIKLPFEITDFKIGSANNPTLIKLFKELEFKNWLMELMEESAVANKEKYAHYTLITTEKELKSWVQAIQEKKQFAFEVLTTLPDAFRSELVGLSVATAPGHAAYVPFGHAYHDIPSQLSREMVLSEFKPLLENKHIQKISHHMKYAMEIFPSCQINPQGFDFDTMLESYVLDTTSSSHDLDSLAIKYLGWRTTSFKDVAGTGTKQLSFDHVAIDKAGVYAAEDVDVTLRLHALLWPKIQKEKKLKKVFEEIEMPLSHVLARMESNGVLIDPVLLKKQGKTLQARLDTLEKSVYQIAGREFNMNSPKQLQEILFGLLKLPVLQKTPKGQPSTADNVLQELAAEFELPRLIIEYRSLSKLISTYTTPLIEQINPKTGRVHTSYNQTGTATGRLSSSNPNLQNIPIRTNEGRRIRQAFIATPSHSILRADYSQIELRLMAHISEDPTLIDAFKMNLDIHSATAAEVWEVPLEEVTAQLRRNAKIINFGLIYGMSAFGLTRQLGLERKAAEEYIERYFARYPKVKNYINSIREIAREQGFVETLWGRRIYIPDIRASQIPRQKAAERIAINAPLQGSAADIIKLAMIQIDAWLQKKDLKTKMIMQVHDELVFETPNEEIGTVKENIGEYMVSVAKLKVPLQVSIGCGLNWDEASKD